MVRIAFLFLIISFVFTGCSKKVKVHQVENDEVSAYSIRLITFSQKDSALKYAENLGELDKQEISVISADTSKSSNRFAVEVSGFSSSFSAGMKAYELLKKDLIKSYQITFNRLPVYDEFSNLFFVARHGNHPSVFTYSLKTKKHKMFWSHPGESVVELNSSKDGRTVFFLTASDYGRKTIFPYINNVIIYRIDLSSLKVEKLKELGNGVQLFTSWETPATFKVVFNQFDQKRSTFVNQTSLIFNNNGKILNNDKITYDIVKEKYPVPEISGSEIISSGNKRDIMVSKKNNQNILTLTDSVKTKKDIYSTPDIINSVEWWKDGKYFVFSTYDINPRNRTLRSSNPQTSSLSIVSASDGKILHSWKGGGYKNFLLRGDLLFFDDGFDNNSKILIYDLDDNKIINTLAIRGGCGVRNIPTIPY